MMDQIFKEIFNLKSTSVGFPLHGRQVDAFLRQLSRGGGIWRRDTTEISLSAVVHFFFRGSEGRRDWEVVKAARLAEVRRCTLNLTTPRRH